MRPLRPLVLCVIWCAALPVVSAAQGGEYVALAHSDFFGFFHVSEVGRRAGANGETVVALKTGGFRDKVDLSVSIDRRNDVRAARLLLDRQWVGNRTTINPFATDIVSSFLRTFIPKQDETQNSYFVAALRVYKGDRDSVIVLRQPDSPTSVTPPDVRQALEVLAGARPRFDLRMSASELHIENLDESGRPRLRLTVLRLQVPRRAEEGAAVERYSSRGATLAGVLAVPEAITGQLYVAIVNREKITDADARLSQKILATPDELLIELPLLLAQEGIVELAVNDGASGHAINLLGTSAGLDTVRYWDPWGRGSFLERGNNRAGVAAVQAASDARQWLITTAELRRVVYAVIVSLASVKRLAAFQSLVASDQRSAIAEYRRLARADPDSVPADSTLDGMGRVLLAQHRAQAALVTYMILQALHPASARAAIGAGRAALAANDSAGAASHFRDAIARAGSDTSLSAVERQQLRAAAEMYLQGLGTPLRPPDEDNYWE